jgi:hypothetical protein
VEFNKGSLQEGYGLASTSSWRSAHHQLKMLESARQRLITRIEKQFGSPDPHGSSARDYGLLSLPILRYIDIRARGRCAIRLTDRTCPSTWFYAPGGWSGRHPIIRPPQA